MNKMPTATLASGVKVANFSSPHEFRFTDGTELASCTPARTMAGSLRAVEIETERELWTDLSLSFELNKQVTELLVQALLAWTDGKVDLVLCPLPVMKSLEAVDWTLNGVRFDTHPFRSVRMADRINKVIFHDRFCL